MGVPRTLEYLAIITRSNSLEKYLTVLPHIDNTLAEALVIRDGSTALKGVYLFENVVGEEVHHVLWQTLLPRMHATGLLHHMSGSHDEVEKAVDDLVKSAHA